MKVASSCFPDFGRESASFSLRVNMVANCMDGDDSPWQRVSEYAQSTRLSRSSWARCDSRARRIPSVHISDHQSSPEEILIRSAARCLGALFQKLHLAPHADVTDVSLVLEVWHTESLVALAAQHYMIGRGIIIIIQVLVFKDSITISYQKNS